MLHGLGLDLKLSKKVLTAYKWYYEHFEQLSNEKKVYLLVQSKRKYLEILNQAEGKLKQNIIDMNDFVLRHKDAYPELENFLGFAENDTSMVDIEMD